MDIHNYLHENSDILSDSQSANLLGSFRSNQISTCELLLSSTNTVSRKLNIADSIIQNFVKKYESEKLESSLKTVKLPLQDQSENNLPNFFTTGDESIDTALNGGIPIGHLIEVSGKSSCGKTNFILALSITIQLPLEFGGLGPSVFSESDSDVNTIKTLYIPTESHLPTDRLTQIVENYSNLLQTNGISKERIGCFPKLDNVVTCSKVMADLDEQDHILKYQVPVMLERDPSIKLLVIDSLTHHLRADLPGFKQAEYVLNMCQNLKTLSKKHGITVIITNQVSDKPVSGLYTADNDMLWKLNMEYQLSWMNGWDDVGIIYRQLMKSEGVVDEAGRSFEKLEYLDEINSSMKTQSVSLEDVSSEDFSSFSSTQQKQDLKSLLKSERKKLFDNTYKVKVSGIGTRPALGLPLLNSVDMRIILSKEYSPILNEKLIDEFSVELGIDSSFSQNDELVSPPNEGPLLTSTQSVSDKPENQQFLSALENNSYLKNYNFESYRKLRCVFGPLIPAGETRIVEFEIWKGGIRKYIR